MICFILALFSYHLLNQSIGFGSGVVRAYLCWYNYCVNVTCEYEINFLRFKLTSRDIYFRKQTLSVLHYSSWIFSAIIRATSKLRLKIQMTLTFLKGISFHL